VSKKYASGGSSSSGSSTSVVDADSNTKVQVEESSDENKIRFDTAGTERMIIDENGKVGIGTSSPDAPLHVRNTDTTANCLRIETESEHTNAAPDISFFRNDASMVDNQNLGVIKFDGIEEHSGGSDAEITYVSIVGCAVDATSDHATDSKAEGSIKLYIKQTDDAGTSGSPFSSFQFYGASANVGGADSTRPYAATLGLFEGTNRAPNLEQTGHLGHIWVKTGKKLMFTSQESSPTDFPVLLGGKHSIWIPAEGISPRSNAGCAELATTAAATVGRPDIRALAFDKDSDEHAQFTIAMPKMWNEGTITAQFYWTNASATSGGVSWGLQAVSLSNDDLINTAFGTAVVTDDTQTGTAKDVHVSPESSAITIGGSPAADDLTVFQVYRDVSDSNDNLNEDALLLGIKIFYTISGHHDE